MHDTLSIAGLSVASNQKISEIVPISVGGVDINFPLYLINGARPGPRLVITAGIHGAEYPCIEAATRLGRSLDPSAISGQVVIAPIANPISFAARSIYVSPQDNKNLNRQFPGDPDGTFSQALAFWLFTQIISVADYYIDLHGGDMIEALMPFGCYVETGQAELDGKAEALAIHFGLPYLALKERSSIAGTTHMAAADAQIPALLAEAGGQGLLTEADVLTLESGVRRVMGSLAMLADVPLLPSSPEQFGSWRWLRSQVAGLYYPIVKVGEEVFAGQDLGRVADVFGATLQPLHAPVDGRVLFLVTSLAINANDPLLAIVS
jgi:predicted deacylase